MTKECISLLNRNMKTPGVYCLTYEMNGQKYIGSSVNIGHRIWGGIFGYNEIVQSKNFEYLTISILEVCERNIDLLRYRESYWIDKLNTYYPFGMNIADPIKKGFNQSRAAKRNIAINPHTLLHNENHIIELERYRIMCHKDPAPVRYNDARGYAVYQIPRERNPVDVRELVRKLKNTAFANELHPPKKISRPKIETKMTF